MKTAIRFLALTIKVELVSGVNKRYHRCILTHTAPLLIPALLVNEIRKRLSVFALHWQGTASEGKNAQPFWVGFYAGDRSDAARVAFLFNLYGKLTSLLPADKPRQTRRTRSTEAKVRKLKGIRALAASGNFIPESTENRKSISVDLALA